MSYLNQIQHSLDYVEGHRTEPLTVEDLASQIGFSPYHYSENGQNVRDIPKFWEEYLRLEKGKHLHSQPNVVSDAEYGICFDMSMETNSFNYYIGVEVSDFSGLDPQFQTTEIPAATYAVFTTPPTERSKLSDQIQSTWAYIYNEWFPNSAYEFAQGCADFELYDERCLRDTGCVMEIWIPIG